MRSLLLVFVALVVITVCITNIFARTWYIKPDGPGHALTIQAGIDSSAAGDTVAVSEGEYQEKINLKNGIQVLGGWNTQFTLRDPKIYITAINGQGSGSVVTAYWPVDNSCILDGFVIKNGTGTEDTRNPGYYLGGGILVWNTLGPKISNNEICQNNVSNGSGGGIFVNDSSPIIHKNIIINNWCSGSGGGIDLGNSCCGEVTNNIIANNRADRDGGGIRADLGAFLFEGNEVSGNICGINGGGISLDHSAAHIVGNKISGNTAVSHGGGIFGYAISSVVDSNLIFNNHGGAGGGCLFSAIPQPHLRSNTIVENHSNEHGQISLGENCSPVIENNIIAKEKNRLGLYCAPGSAPTLICNDFWGNKTGNYGGTCSDQTGINGNFSADPQFCGIFSSSNYYLQSDSPCAPGNHPYGENCGLIGAYPVGCGPISTKETSWGKVKKIYK